MWTSSEHSKRNTESQPRHVLWALVLTFTALGVVATGAIAIASSSQTGNWHYRNIYNKWAGEEPGKLGSDVPVTAITGGFSIALFGIFIGLLSSYRVRRQPTGVAANPAFFDIGHELGHAVTAYLIRRTAILVLLVAGWSCGIFPMDVFGDWWRTMLCFIAASIVNLEQVLLASNGVVVTVARAAHALTSSVSSASNVALLGASVAGLNGVGLMTLLVGGNFLIFRDMRFAAGLIYAMSLSTVLDRLIAGAFKGVSLGNGAHGRNRYDSSRGASVADLVGEHVTSAIGLSSDILESFLIALTLAVTFGSEPFGLKGVSAPFWLAGIAAASGVIGTLVLYSVGVADGTRTAQAEATARNIFIAIKAATIVNIGFSPLVFWYFTIGWRGYVAYVIGAGAALFISHRGSRYSTVGNCVSHHIRSQFHCITGAFVTGFGAGSHSTFLEMACIFLTIICPMTLGQDFDSRPRGGADYLAAIAVLGYTSIGAVMATLGAFGAIAENAHAATKLTKTDEAVEKNAETLRDYGEASAGVARAYAAGAAILAAHILVRAVVVTFFTFHYEVARGDFSVVNDAIVVGKDFIWRPVGAEVFYGMDPHLLPEYTINLLEKRALAGLILGAMFPYLIASLNLFGSSAAAQLSAEEQSSTEDHRFSTFTGTVAFSAVRYAIIPIFFTLALPTVIGFAVGPYMLIPLLFAAIVSGYVLSVSFNNSASAWTATRRYIDAESSHPDAHSADSANVVDEVGDRLKDSASGLLNSVIKVMPALALVFNVAFISACHEKHVLWESHCFSNMPISSLPKIRNA